MSCGGGAAAMSGSGSSSIKQVKLERESELRIEVGHHTPLRLRLLNGSAEIFGSELAPEIWLTFPPRLKFAVFTWHGATIEMDGATETDYATEEGPRVMVVGPTDSGKGTLSRMFLSWGAGQGWKATFVDLDIEQGSITIPASIAATPIELPVDSVEGIPLKIPLVYFYGHTTPSNNVDLYKALVNELAQVLENQFARNAEFRAAWMVIDTMGRIEAAPPCN